MKYTVFIGMFDNYGQVKTSPKPDKKADNKGRWKEPQDRIDICLNCTKDNCKGTCALFKQHGNKKK